MKQLLIDTAHSDMGFKVRHMMVSNVKGTLTEYSGGMKYEKEDMPDAEIRFEGDIRSITTGNSDRDAHLNGEDFFHSERFPKIYFESTSIDLENNKLKGDLTIKDTTKEVELSVEYNGRRVDPWGNIKHGFEIKGTVNRSDFDLTWNTILETGGLLISNEVKLDLDIQMLETVGELQSEETML